MGLEVTSATRQDVPSRSRQRKLALGCIAALVALCIIALAVAYCALVWLPYPLLWIEGLRPPPWRLRTKPTSGDVVATYVLDSSSSRDLGEIGYGPIPPDSSITFNSDGTFVSVHIPDVLWEWGNAEHKYKSGSGTWSLSEGPQGNWVIDATFIEVEGTSTTAYANQFWLFDDGPPFSLFNWFTDTRGLIWRPR